MNKAAKTMVGISDGILADAKRRAKDEAFLSYAVSTQHANQAVLLAVGALSGKRPPADLDEAEAIFRRQSSSASFEGAAQSWADFRMKAQRVAAVEDPDVSAAEAHLVVEAAAQFVEVVQRMLNLKKP